jgi:hypothetical protein
MHYNELVTELKRLKPSGPAWPNDEFPFPQKLEDSLDVENPHKLKRALESQM